MIALTRQPNGVVAFPEGGLEFGTDFGGVHGGWFYHELS